LAGAANHFTSRSLPPSRTLQGCTSSADINTVKSPIGVLAPDHRVLGHTIGTPGPRSFVHDRWSSIARPARIDRIGRRQRRTQLLWAACAALTVLLLAGCVSAPSAYARKKVAHVPRRLRAHIAVIGGQGADPGTFPWMAYILDIHANTVGQCSGTVVAPDLVLTAAHCAEDPQSGVVNEASGYSVLTGNVDWNAPAAQRQLSGVLRVIPCPCWDRRTKVGDVALLQLASATTAPAVTFAAIPGGDAAAVFAGWGRTYPGQSTIVEDLQWAHTVVQRPGWCEREAPPFDPSSELCILDSPAGQTGACNGDSGGPLLLPYPPAVGGMVQVGVASHAYNECATTRPSVFTRVDAVSSWVRAWEQTLSAPAAPAPPTSASAVPVPSLAGLATGRSLTVEGNRISLVLGCGSEGGVCGGRVDAAATVFVRLIATGYGRTTVSTHTHRLTLASAKFRIAPGASAVIHSTLSTQDRVLLSRLGNGPLDVRLAGQGVVPGVLRLAGR
jgi:trypsin